MSTPTIHDVDNYGRHSVMPGRHTVADLASRALGRVADLSKQHSEYGRQPELTITQHITTKENGQS